MTRYYKPAEVFEDLENRFTYHPVIANQGERYQEIRNAAKELSKLLHVNCPTSRELSLALTHLEESVFWANASIARNEMAKEEE